MTVRAPVEQTPESQSQSVEGNDERLHEEINATETTAIVLEDALKGAQVCLANRPNVPQ